VVVYRTTVSPLFATLRALLEARVAPAALTHLDAELGADAAADREALLLAFASAGRWVGRGDVATSPEEVAALRGADLATVSAWRVDDVARVLLLLRAAATDPGAPLEGLVADAWARGDTDERRAVLRALALLPSPERFVPLAVDACRTNVQPLFEAIAAENPFPAAHFPAPNFNQMVLKALYTGVALDRVVGLGARVTPELRRMATDFRSERRAAGRTISADVERLATGGAWR
jgi:hypothetical protein